MNIWSSLEKIMHNRIKHDQIISDIYLIMLCQTGAIIKMTAHYS